MRLNFLDDLRGIAVVCMIIFHFAYDLKTFGLINTDFTIGFWYYFPRMIAFTFLFCVGCSLFYTYSEKFELRKFFKRQLKLFLSACMISISTFFLFPTQWIYFGTLHCIFVCSLIALPLVKRPKLNWTLLLSVIIFQYGLNYDIKWVSSLLQRPSMDFIPFYPWIWVVLLGIAMAPHLKTFFDGRCLTKKPFLAFLSQHSLKIYLLHQPVIFGLIWLYKSA